MTIPDIPAHPLPEGDDDVIARRLLALVDANPARTVIVTVDDAPDDEVDEHEARMSRVFDIARDERPELAVKILPAGYKGDHCGVTALAVVIHEHEFVGGACVHGCGQTRDVA